MEAIFIFKVQDGSGPSQMLGSLMQKQDFRSYLWENRGQEIIITLSPAAKTPEKERMYAFYHKVVLGVAVSVFSDLGWEAMDRVKADYILKAECAKGIMYNKITGQEDIYLEDKSAMTKDRLHKYISDCIHLLESEFGATVPDSAGFGRPDNNGFVSI